MAESTTNTRFYMLLFIISLVATIGFMIFAPQWFWVVLPFLFTYFVKGMDWV